MSTGRVERPVSGVLSRFVENQAGRVEVGQDEACVAERGVERAGVAVQARALSGHGRADPESSRCRMPCGAIRSEKMASGTLNACRVASASTPPTSQREPCGSLCPGQSPESPPDRRYFWSTPNGGRFVGSSSRPPLPEDGIHCFDPAAAPVTTAVSVPSAVNWLAHAWRKPGCESLAATPFCSASQPCLWQSAAILR